MGDSLGIQLRPENNGRDESKGKEMEFEGSQEILMKNRCGVRTINRKKITQITKTCLCGLRDSQRRETGCILSVKTEAGWREEISISYRRI